MSFNGLYKESELEDLSFAKFMIYVQKVLLLHDPFDHICQYKVFEILQCVHYVGYILLKIN